MIKHSVICLLLAIISTGYAYEDCGSKVGELIRVTVSGCDDPDARCILKRNTNATLQIEMKLTKDANKVKSVVHGVILGLPYPFVVPNPDGCLDSGLTCPLKTGGPYIYKSILPVHKDYPRVTVDVKWELQNELGEDIICVLIPSKIK